MIASSPFDPAVRHFVIKKYGPIGPFSIFVEGREEPVASVSWEEEMEMLKKFESLGVPNLAIQELKFRAWEWAMGEVLLEGATES